MSTPEQVPQDQSLEAYDFAHCQTRADRSGPYNKFDVTAAILATRGNFTEMALLLGRRRNAVRDYVYANLEVKDVLDEIREIWLDEAESKHNSLAKAEDGPALRFILGTLGKDRGYSSRIEQTGRDGAPIQLQTITLDVSKLSIEQLRAIKDAAIHRNGSSTDHE